MNNLRLDAQCHSEVWLSDQSLQHCGPIAELGQQIVPGRSRVAGLFEGVIAGSGLGGGRNDNVREAGSY